MSTLNLEKQIGLKNKMMIDGLILFGCAICGVIMLALPIMLGPKDKLIGKRNRLWSF